jgi:hypothetical protein
MVEETGVPGSGTLSALKIPLYGVTYLMPRAGIEPTPRTQPLASKSDPPDAVRTNVHAYVVNRVPPNFTNKLLPTLYAVKVGSMHCNHTESKVAN